MSNHANGNRMLGFVVTSALTGVLLSGCAASVAEPASVSANRAEEALAAGKSERAVRHAETAVLADPRNAAYRATLGSAYLEAGRFASAATSFHDAMALGDASGRTVLSLSLALTGQGRFDEAALLLNDHERDIATADLGLAYALAGEPGRGIHVMSNAIRGGENTAKMRQNLAFSYALAGRWREARLMAEQDVPADKVSERIEQWARMAHPQATQQRVAGLLGVPTGTIDMGQPVQLALANTPSIEELALGTAPTPDPVEAAYADTPAQVAELPPLALQPEPAVELPPVAVAPVVPTLEESFSRAFAAPVAAPAVAQDAARFAASPVGLTSTQQAPASRVVADADGSHLIQLGSFLSEDGARRAWSIYASRYPELAGHRMVISRAVVKGKQYWRVSAAGFAPSAATAMCGKVRAHGEGCFAYAEGRPLPGAVNSGMMLARR
ncbi:MAG TPA: SPOR domain-containing protein [Croceibacterium sp.]|nr:SPOR domain-containing protein [Croceibacterium sp.]